MAQTDDPGPPHTGRAVLGGGMVPVVGRGFLMGSADFYPEERPVRGKRVGSFWIDRCQVTNAQFAAFVAATGYVTVAERPLDPEGFPGATAELLQPGGLVFQQTDGPVPLNDYTAWWRYQPGASWRTPRGPGTDVELLADHPVVQVAYEDASTYAAWRGARLPTEAEWEFAARGGLDGSVYTWGDQPDSDGPYLANTWRGRFPWQNLALDGYEATSPVGSFPANGYGLHDMAGNVWEWTSDWWHEGHRPAAHACCGTDDGRSTAAPGEGVPRRVIKGGSHLCSPDYCLRYRPAARQPEAVDTATCHLGFRCVVDRSADAATA
ncbi:formylglycine-generating enzyme family protein [Isoptericola sp. F-RaC21]|uniref:formylglycine-generating enzyme family protein n=1 Tax=Isoptericola sp. F-RaC21 TaxID=3141452 RepID=UPI00315BDAAF